LPDVRLADAFVVIIIIIDVSTSEKSDELTWLRGYNARKGGRGEE